MSDVLNANVRADLWRQEEKNSEKWSKLNHYIVMSISHSLLQFTPYTNIVFDFLFFILRVSIKFLFQPLYLFYIGTADCILYHRSRILWWCRMGSRWEGSWLQIVSGRVSFCGQVHGMANNTRNCNSEKWC